VCRRPRRPRSATKSQSAETAPPGQAAAEPGELLRLVDEAEGGQSLSGYGEALRESQVMPPLPRSWARKCSTGARRAAASCSSESELENLCRRRWYCPCDGRAARPRPPPQPSSVAAPRRAHEAFCCSAGCAAERWRPPLPRQATPSGAAQGASASPSLLSQQSATYLLFRLSL